MIDDIVQVVFEINNFMHKVMSPKKEYIGMRNNEI